MNRWLTRIALALVGVILLLPNARPAFADRSEYFEVYGTQTAAKGEVEIELWNEFLSKSRQDTQEEHAGHQISVEYGITNRFTAELYAEFRENPTGQGFQYTKTKLETRYRLTNPHTNSLNVGLYAEYEKSAIAGRPDALEGKLLLSKDFGPLNISANAIFEKDLEAGSKVEFAYAGGVSYPLNKDVLVSVETLVRPMNGQVFVIPGVHWSGGAHDYFGVGVSLQTAPTPFNATLRTFWAHEF